MFLEIAQYAGSYLSVNMQLPVLTIIQEFLRSIRLFTHFVNFPIPLCAVSVAFSETVNLSSTMRQKMK